MAVTVVSEAKSSLIGHLLAVAASYCVATSSSFASVSKAIFGRGGHLADLENGERDISTGTYERAMLWFSDNWPEHVEWPADIARPTGKTPNVEAAE